MSVKSGKLLKFITCFILISFLLPDPVLNKKPNVNYCAVKCPRGKHTVCKRRHKCGPVSGCHPILADVAFRELMVKEHNEFRAKVASGKDGGKYGSKGAKNMRAISYDMEMEYIARCWINTCTTMKHDDCKSSKRFHCGQNIFWSFNSNATKSANKAWYDEIEYITERSWIDKYPRNFPNDGKARGHYTQLVWAKTTYVGCARVRYGKKNLEEQLICNYGPAGNFIGEPVYKIAEDSSQIASECEGGKNKDYPSLCGKIDPIPTEKEWGGVGKLNANLILMEFSVVILWFIFM